MFKSVIRQIRLQAALRDGITEKEFEQNELMQILKTSFEPDYSDIQKQIMMIRSKQ